MQKQTIIISGPTASGKTAVAVELCKKINGEIISADSRQIYKYLDRGTNKEGVLSDNGIRYISSVPQHLTDIIEPNCKYSTKKFETDSEQIEKELLLKGKVPVVTGGTGLYIKSFLYGLDELPDADEKIRAEIQKEIEEKGLESVYQKLLKADPVSAEKNKGNTQRIIRAFEIYKLTGKTMTEFLNKKTKKNRDFRHFVIFKDREILYKDINNRCKLMVNSGMIEETEKVLKMGFKKDSPALTGVGYKNIISYLENKITKKELIDIFSAETRQYAKRQITWFKSQPDIIVLDGSQKGLVDDVLKHVS
ncbi:MAG: tRNA (adenosine(37)-N6)-dimethylallyltransferase MiaA [Endomicrobiaceae bacterium]|jgi:tRNA dimethylallyltransferase|nr:tRNA (adenosine(37)-N6)-dimethylallyltransferase MiaA [Endomicrobiaceae bacterium]MDD3730571.1 tRNA (adenosine(37)-N6)-dimethylallyltransferase MiaA [Endomicrobiaceae bacterium]MDD4165940.1 tRNA (adenosine(37)-N6)-dimethylallyltransferase MiaA [Endomicrobiaceae bacterium]